jgi:F-type H+-transporting ATPase subunit c
MTTDQGASETGEAAEHSSSQHVEKGVSIQGNSQEKKGARGMNRKQALIRVAALLGLFTLALPAVVMAEDAAEGAGGDFLMKFGLAIGAGVGLGVAAFGGGLGQGKTAAAALEGIARNPGAADKMFVPMIIGLALIESLVLYTFIIAILLQAKI